MVKAFVGKVSLYRKSFIQRFRLKSDGADDAKPEAKKTLRKENTETFALFRREKSNIKAGTRQQNYIIFSWFSWTPPLKNRNTQLKIVKICIN